MNTRAAFDSVRFSMPPTRTPTTTRRFKRTARSTKPRPAGPETSAPLQRKYNHSDRSQLQLTRTVGTPRPILPPEFFLVDALDLAPRLLGKFLRRDEVMLQITEVEAYRSNDTACHARVGITPRTAPLFGPGGHAYVYLCYGMHMMLNVVADKEGLGAAVLVRSCAPICGMLLRSCAPICGLDIIQERRGQKTDKPILLAGPGKVGQALGLTTEWSGHPLFTPGGLELLDGPKPEEILVGPRVGIDYASPEHVKAPWRFAISGHAWISAPKNTLT